MVWYGLRTFQVLQLKGPDLAPEKLAEEIIRHEQTRPAWVPLPPTTEHSDS